MKNQFKLLLALLCAISLVACKKEEQDSTKTRQPQAPAEGTVDGGGGDTIVDSTTGAGQLLDLAEATGKEPFDYDIRSLTINEFGENEYMKPWGAYQGIRTTTILSEIMQDDADFYGWALTEAMYSNSEKSSEYFDHSLKEIHVAAFNLKDRQIINNLQYGFTDKPLEEIRDEGAIAIDNPTTKKQLAVQDGHGNVLVNRTEFNRLDFNSKLALKLHESVLYLVLRFNPALIKESGTAPIRKFVRDYFSYTYLSEMKGVPQISREEVQASFKALKLPTMIADYSQIRELSVNNIGKIDACELTRSGDSINYYFSKNGKTITGAYAMNVEFYMKIQLYLVKRGICVFQPKACEMKSIESSHYDGPTQVITTAWGLVRGGMVLPIQSQHVHYVQNVLLPLYKTAQICE